MHDSGPVDHTHVNPLGLAVTVYPVIVAPLLAGAVQMTVACVLPALAATVVGTPGAVDGVTEFDAVDCALVPTLLVAVTLNVYAVPSVNPVTVVDAAAGLPLTVRPVQPPHAGVGTTV
jgi:hypothetical protein